MKAVLSSDCGACRSAISPKCGVCGIADVEVAVEIEAEVGEPGSRCTKKMADPRMPTQTEIDEHSKTHLPYRSWCSLCVKGRGKEMLHTKATLDKALSEVHLDFMFLGPKGATGETMPCLVAREGLTKIPMSAAMPSKSTGAYIANRVIAFLREIGSPHCEIGPGIGDSERNQRGRKTSSDCGRRLVHCGIKSGGIQCFKWRGGTCYPVRGGLGARVEVGVGDAMGLGDSSKTSSIALACRVCGIPLEPLRSWT